jgi:predicted ArsR family transcriptional regulator
MLDALITSKTRVRLLVKFFLNPTMKSYLRQLADEFGESTNAVRVELNRLTEAGILESEANGNVINYKAKESHPLIP